MLRISIERWCRVVALFACTACASPDASEKPSAYLNEAQPDGPVGLSLLDSVPLAESDSVTLGMPAGLLIDGRGRIWVADNGDKRVHLFDSTGRHLALLGRRGSGPGEFESVGALAMLGDTLLLVKNLARSRVEAFDARTRTYRWGRTIPARFFDLVADGGTVSGAAMNGTGQYAVSAFTDSAGALATDGAVPALYREAPMLIGPFGTVVHARRGAQLALAFEGADYLYFRGRAGAPFDSILLPRLRRRGAATELLREVVRDTSRGREALFKSSLPMTAAYVNDSIVAVVHGDVTLRGTQFEGAYHVSLLDVRRYRVCIDLPLPVPTDPVPQLHLRDTQLYALVQHIGKTDGGTTAMLRFRLDTGKCAWNFVQKH